MRAGFVERHDETGPGTVDFESVIRPPVRKRIDGRPGVPRQTPEAVPGGVEDPPEGAGVEKLKALNVHHG